MKRLQDVSIYSFILPQVICLKEGKTRKREERDLSSVHKTVVTQKMLYNFFFLLFFDDTKRQILKLVEMRQVLIGRSNTY